MKSTIFLVALPALLLGACCRKGDTPVLSSDSITGRWKLVTVTSGFTGQVMTAKEWGHTMTLNFQAPDKLTETYDGVPTDYTYEVKKDTSYIFGSERDFLFRNGERSSIISLHRDTLSLAMDAADGGGATYVRTY